MVRYMVRFRNWPLFVSLKKSCRTYFQNKFPSLIAQKKISLREVVDRAQSLEHLSNLLHTPSHQVQLRIFRTIQRSPRNLALLSNQNIFSQLLYLRQSRGIHFLQPQRINSKLLQLLISPRNILHLPNLFNKCLGNLLVLLF